MGFDVEQNIFEGHVYAQLQKMFVSNFISCFARPPLFHLTKSNVAGVLVVLRLSTSFLIFF